MGYPFWSSLILISGLALTMNHCNSNEVNADYRFAGKWKSQKGCEFKSVYDLSLAPDETIFIADYRNNRVCQLDLQGKLLAKFEGIDSPHGIFAGPEGTFYVVNYRGNKVKKFDAQGKLVLEFGKEGIAAGEFGGVVSVAVNPQGEMFVADYHNHRIQKFDSKGRFLKMWGKEGIGHGEFKTPHALALDSEGHVYVADRGNGRIQVFNAEGEFLKVFPSAEQSLGKVEPMGVTVDSQNQVYVADMAQHRILKFSKDGELLTQWGRQGSGNGEFNVPTNSAVTSSGKVFVSEEKNLRIQIFEPVKKEQP